MNNPHHTDYIEFPNPELANEHGFLAHGGDLNINTLLSAYQQGIFPWFNDNEPILWWSPNPRMIMPTAGMHISRSLRKTMRSNQFQITCGQSFEQVIDACSRPRAPTQDLSPDDESSQTWITADMKKAYVDLHLAGFAQSVECWKNDKLVGGLYGVCIAGMFFGESMFSKRKDSSKIALASLCHFLVQNGIGWIDCQVESPHLVSLGAVNINRDDFLEKISHQLKNPIILDWETFHLPTF